MASELRSLQKVDHPHLLRFIEAFRDSKNYYVVTEHCQGGELFNYVLDKVQLAEKEAKIMTLKLC